ncbi:MAG: hypothetical protein OEL57_02875, partial [Trichlorobacter sp.]|uniref:hypothetical protein n=1 Tax=Trichlorobacter sp. TaxID=2911007 RepID=UPI002563AB67
LAGHDGHNLHLYNPRDVIYLEEVLRFEAEHKIGQRQVKAKQRDPDNPKSKNTLLQIIAVMAIKGYKYNPNDQRSTVPATIVNSAQSMGITLDQKTVREWLQQAAECIPPE